MNKGICFHSARSARGGVHVFFLKKGKRFAGSGSAVHGGTE